MTMMIKSTLILTPINSIKTSNIKIIQNSNKVWNKNQIQSERKRSIDQSRQSLIEDKMEDDHDKISQVEKQIKSTLKPSNKEDWDGPMTPANNGHLKSQYSNSLQSLLEKNENVSHVTNTKKQKYSKNIQKQKSMKLSTQNALNEKQLFKDDLKASYKSLKEVNNQSEKKQVDLTQIDQRTLKTVALINELRTMIFESSGDDKELRYKDRDYKVFSSKELQKVYEQQKEELPKSKFFEEMQQANTFFSDDGFKQFKCNSRAIKKEYKGFYYVFDNKLFVLKQRKKKESEKFKVKKKDKKEDDEVQNSILTKKENKKKESGIEFEERIHLESGGDDDPYDRGNSLNQMFLSMIKENHYDADKFFEKDAKEYYKSLSSEQLKKYQINDRQKKSNFVISVYQMPELSHITDIDTGLLRVSTKTKLVVKSLHQFVLYDKYCIITIFTTNSEKLNVQYSDQIVRSIFLIDDENKDHDEDKDKILGIVTQKDNVILVFLKNGHVKLRFQNHRSLKHEYYLNELFDQNDFESNSTKQLLTFDKVICCEGNVGVGIKNKESDEKPGYFVFINRDGKMVHKKPFTDFLYKKPRQMIRQFYTLLESKQSQKLKIGTYIVANQQLQEINIQFQVNELKLDEQVIFGMLIAGGVSSNDIEYCTDQPYQLIFHEDQTEGKKVIVIDFLNSNLQTYSFWYTGDWPEAGIINNKNYMLKTENSDDLQNIYLGDLKFVEISLSKRESPIGIQIKHLSQTLLDSQIYLSRFIRFNRLEVPLQHRFRQKQICSSFMKKRIVKDLREENDKLSPVDPWKSSMKKISLNKLALAINQHYKWNWELDYYHSGQLVFTKHQINFKNLLDQNNTIQKVKVKVVEDNLFVQFVTISPDLMHIFLITNENSGYIQRLNIQDGKSIDDIEIKHHSYNFKIENSFDVVSFCNDELILISFSQDVNQKNFRLHLKRYSYHFDVLNNTGIVKQKQTIDLSRYNRMWDQNSRSFQKCLGEEPDIALRFGDYNFIFNQFIIIQQKNDVLVFMKDSFEFKGSYRFNDNTRKLKVIDKILYIDQDHYQGQACLQGEEDMFTFLNRLNPDKLSTIVHKDLQRLTFLNPDDEEIGFVPFRHGHKIFMHRIMFSLDPQDIEVQQYINNLDEVQLSLELGKNMQNCDGSFGHMLVSRSYRNVQFLQKRLIQINKKNIPKLFRSNIQNQTPFDIAMKEKDFQSIIILLDIMIKYQNHIVYNYLVDPHINFLIEKRANLEDYFNSNLPISKIKNKSYQDYSNDNRTIIHADFDQNQSVNYIMNNYDEVFKNVKLVIDGSAIQIEYFLINMPKTIQSKDFIQNLSKVNDLDIFESECIQFILDYKWDTYTNNFFLMQFTTFILFLIAYLIDLYFFVVQGSERQLSQQLIVKLTCACTLMASAYYEFILMRKQTFKVYIQEGWNFFDLWMILHYLLILIIDVQNEIPEGIVILQGVMLVLIFLKLCQNLRIFQGFSFQVTMLQAVFYDIKYFILLYAFVIFMYGLIFTLLRIKTSEENDDYEGISLFGYFIMAFRASTGDFQVDQFKELQEEHIIYAWIMWISAVLFLNIILLNFIIAVISESYEKVMQKMIAESYRIKCQLVKERELLLDDNDLKDSKKFPRYIIIRRPVTEKEDASSEWQGFVKDIKRNLLKVTQTLSLEIDTKHQVMLDRLDLVMKDHELIKDEITQQQQLFNRIMDQQNQNQRKQQKEDKEEIIDKIIDKIMKEMNAKFEKLNVLLPKEEVKESEKKEEEKKEKIGEEVDKAEQSNSEEKIKSVKLVKRKSRFDKNDSYGSFEQNDDDEEKTSKRHSDVINDDE
eukprot:403362967